jgi:hypothetical protein
MKLQAGPDRCEEASTLSRETYIPCNGPAEYVVKFASGEGPYRMCEMCMFHNFRNRGVYRVDQFKAESVSA